MFFGASCYYSSMFKDIPLSMIEFPTRPCSLFAADFRLRHWRESKREGERKREQKKERKMMVLGQRF